ncbi:MAG: hypothetical protein IH988_11675 [Planctomycetes bacterium]|nr:hypothetical protein [Planctomycetota bacterium]
MVDTMTSILAANPEVPAALALSSVYVVCLIVGGGLIVVSTLFGGNADVDVEIGGAAVADVGVDINADVGVGADADIGADVDVGAGAVHGAHVHAPSGLSLASWFSIQFVVYFLAVFGLVGTTLTRLSSAGSMTTLLWSVIGGLGIGQGVHQLLRYLRRTSGNSASNVGDYLNQPARVTIKIAPPQKGEVSVSVRGRTRFVPAVARRDDDLFESGDPVVVVAYRNGTAEVVSRKEYEFVTDSEAK